MTIDMDLKIQHYQYIFVNIMISFFGTAVFKKVYRTIFQSKRRRLVFKTGVIMYIQNLIQII